MSCSTLVLEPFGQPHLEKTFGWIQQAEVRKGFNFYREITWEDHVNWYKAVCRDSSVQNFAIVLADRNQHIGNCGLKNIDPESRTCEHLIYIGEQGHRGRGYGILATQLVLSHAFEDLGMRKVYLYLSRGNRSARHLYQRVGFVEKALPAGNIWEGSTVPDVMYMEIEQGGGLN